MNTLRRIAEKRTGRMAIAGLATIASAGAFFGAAKAVSSEDVPLTVSVVECTNETVAYDNNQESPETPKLRSTAWETAQVVAKLTLSDQIETGQSETQAVLNIMTKLNPGETMSVLGPESTLDVPIDCWATDVSETRLGEPLVEAR